ncbi:MAG: sugar phosphate isomerase/epimerase, partial [Solirubrobacteraceae bacterium]
LPGEWSLREKLDRIADAGFDGLEVAWTSELPDARAALELLPEYDLEWSIVCFPSTVDEFRTIAERFSGTDVRHVNVQGNLRPYTVLDAVPYVLGWLDIARDAGLTVYFETHRDRMTTDLRFTLQLIDAIPAMKLVGDLSHYVVGEEFAWPIAPTDEALMQRILARCHGFHGRVATREQIQVPLAFPQHQASLELFLRWWEDGFAGWLSQARPEDELIFVPELGPPPYAITGVDGRELSNRWDEALLLKDAARDIWERVSAASGAQP